MTNNDQKLTTGELSAIRRRAAEARWQGKPVTKWRTIRVHEDTYNTLEAARLAAGVTWDGLLLRLAAERRGKGRRA